MSLPPEPDPSDPASIAVFQAGSRVFTVADVLEAAEWRGDLDPFRNRWRARARAAAEAGAEGLEPDPDRLAEALVDFRYARDLVTAEECGRWLARRGLTPDDLVAGISRRLLPEPVSTPPGDPEPEESEDPDWIRDVLLSDEFTAWARALAWRVALEPAPPGAPDGDPFRAPDWSALESAFEAACAAVTRPECLRRELPRQRIPLLRVAITVAEFDDAAAAREAVLCVREDGLPLAGVASEHGLPHSAWRGFFGDLPEDWRTALLGAMPGEVLPPRPPEDPGDGRFTVLQLIERREPTAGEPGVVERLGALLRERHFRELESRRIRWLLEVDLDTGETS